MIYIAIILLFKIVQNLFNKVCSNAIANNTMFLKYLSFRQAVSAALALTAVLFTFSMGQSPAFTLPTALYALMMAISLSLSTYASLTALKSGTMILCGLFGTAGIFVPCIAGIFLFDERISAWQFFGLLLFIVSAYLLIGCSKKIYAAFSFKTFLLLILSMLANGSTMLVQMMFSKYVEDGNAATFNFLAFLLSAIVSFFMFLVLKTRSLAKAKETDTHIPKKILLCGLALSAAVFIISQVSTIAAGILPPIILFPLSNGGSMIICAVVSAAVFKEKLNLKSVLGLILGIASLVIIKLL